jgi:hypothetical protein
MAADEPAARTPAREDFRNEVVPGGQLLDVFALHGKAKARIVFTP